MKCNRNDYFYKIRLFNLKYSNNKRYYLQYILNLYQNINLNLLLMLIFVLSKNTKIILFYIFFDNKQ